MKRDLLLTSLLIENGRSKLICNQKVQDSMVLRREVSVCSADRILAYINAQKVWILSKLINLQVSIIVSDQNISSAEHFEGQSFFQLKPVWQHTASGKSCSAPLKISAMLLNNKITFNVLNKEQNYSLKLLTSDCFSKNVIEFWSCISDGNISSTKTPYHSRYNFCSFPNQNRLNSLSA